MQEEARHADLPWPFFFVFWASKSTCSKNSQIDLSISSIKSQRASTSGGGDQTFNIHVVPTVQHYM